MQTFMDPVSTVMSQPVLTVGPDAQVCELFELSERRQVHHFPIVEDGVLFGIVCTCDLRDAPPDTPVRVLARREVATIEPTRTSGDAARVMAERAVGSALVVGAEGICGIVTRADLQHLADAASRLAEGHCAACGGDQHLRPGPDGAFLCMDCKQRSRGEDWFDTGVGD
jgi:CBS domain-containing protein